jgi:hypothetical protein
MNILSTDETYAMCDNVDESKYRVFSELCKDSTTDKVEAIKYAKESLKNAKDAIQEICKTTDGIKRILYTLHFDKKIFKTKCRICFRKCEIRIEKLNKDLAIHFRNIYYIGQSVYEIGETINSIENPPSKSEYDE